MMKEEFKLFLREWFSLQWGQSRDMDEDKVFLEAYCNPSMILREQLEIGIMTLEMC